MKRIITLFLLLYLLPSPSRAQQTNMLWEKAARAFFTFDLNGSAAILRDMLRDQHTNASDSAKIYRTLALRDWQFEHDYDLAIKRIDSALAIPASGNASLVALSNIATEAQRYPAALDAAEKALHLAATPAEYRDAAIAYANAAYLSSKNNQQPDTRLLNKAGQLLTEVLQQMPGHPQAAKLLVGTGILKRDGRLVLTGWTAYFHFVSADSAYAYLKAPARALSTILPHWKSNTLSATEREQAAQALAKSGFYEHAALLAGPSQKDIIIYAKYLQDLGTLADNYYRLIAIHAAKDSLFERQVMALCAGVLKDLHLPAGKDSLTYEKFLEVIQPRFGTMGFLGGTSSFNAKEICQGHIINVTRKEVLQYGYKASLTFIEIDLMTSNGFISWFSGKRFGNGGWSVNDTIYRIREAYMKEPVEAWTLVTDSTVRKEQLSIFEKAIANTTPDTPTLLAGINIRLRINAMDSLYAALYGQGLRGSELQLQFMNALERKQEDASIFAHEGRHSIDQIYFAKDFEKAPYSEREYRAKLSEIACADFPQYIFGKLVATIGTSGHGMANRRILENALAWMGTHQPEISGYDTTLPAIKQLHLLSASQIQRCFREADPLSKQ
jgi:tetratricopeptide (TPR) repeat protein